MSKGFFYNCCFFFFFVVLSLHSKAQDSTVVKATIDKPSILIGEQIQLTLEASIPENQPIRFFSLDSIPHFEIINPGTIDTANTREGTTLTRVIQLTSFDSGHWVIPSFYLNERLATDSLPIDVQFSSFDTAQAYHDIKDIIEVDPPAENKMQWWWFVSGAVVILIIVLVLALNKKKKPAPVIIAEVKDPYKHAMEQLELLQNAKPDLKEYYSKLVDIFRVYIDDKKDIHSLQQTSDDLLQQLKGLKMPEELYKPLARSLRVSDWVKFARYNPSDTDTKQIFDDIKNAITSIEQMQ